MITNQEYAYRRHLFLEKMKIRCIFQECAEAEARAQAH